MNVETWLGTLVARMLVGMWGRYGSVGQGTLESAPGLCIGSVGHTEPIARFSGYLMDPETNADGVIALRNASPALLAVVAAARADHDPCPTADLEWRVGPCPTCAALAAADALVPKEEPAT